MVPFKQRISTGLSAIIIGVTVFAPALVLAQQNIGNITDQQLGISYGAATGLANTDVRVSTARIIRVVISLLGIVAVVIVLIGGFTWMTAGGNEEKVGEAKKWITAGVIGLAIILMAYSIASFVVSNLVAATTGGYSNF